jgi:hypothetical protein
LRDEFINELGELMKRHNLNIKSLTNIIYGMNNLGTYDEYADIDELLNKKIEKKQIGIFSSSLKKVTEIIERKCKNGKCIKSTNHSVLFSDGEEYIWFDTSGLSRRKLNSITRHYPLSQVYIDKNFDSRFLMDAGLLIFDNVLFI